jgi:hypothetical protein
MNITDAAVHELDMLKEHEKAISRLYATYAHRFSQDRDFWMGLSQEEDQHARWIELLQTKMEEEPSGLIADRFPTVAISYSIRCINKLIENVNQPDLTPVNALSTALDIERALLENRYFDVFASDGAEVRRVLELLAEGTKAHIEKVQRAWRSSKPTTDHQQSPA